MGNRRFDPRRVKIHQSHTVDDIAKALGCHRQTVRHWIKEGMPTVDTRRPTLVAGEVAQAFLKNRYARHKRGLAPGEMYCFRCRAPRAPAGDIADLVATTPKLGCLQGICPRCTTIMNRRVSRAGWRASAGKLNVTFKQRQSGLVDSPEGNANPHFKAWMQDT